MTATVELRPAWSWRYPRCEGLNFASAPLFTDPGDPPRKPPHVCCGHCGADFATAEQ